MAFCSQGQLGSPAFACEPLLPSQEMSVLPFVPDGDSSINVLVSVYKRSQTFSFPKSGTRIRGEKNQR